MAALGPRLSEPVEVEEWQCSVRFAQLTARQRLAFDAEIERLRDAGEMQGSLEIMAWIIAETCHDADGEHAGFTRDQLLDLSPDVLGILSQSAMRANGIGDAGQEEAEGN